MPDKYQLHLKNFRSIQSATIDIAPMTVIYGPSGSGKSSLIYGLLTLRNFLTNPNQNVASLFSYPPISLGGLQEVVHRHETDRSVDLAISVFPRGLVSPTFNLSIAESGGIAGLTIRYYEETGEEVSRDDIRLEIPIPYRGNQQNDKEWPHGSKSNLSWNGIRASFTMSPEEHGNTDMARAVAINERLNLPMEIARSVGFAPIQRGFSKPSYGVSNVTAALATEDEVASLLATDRYHRYRVSDYLEATTGRQLQVNNQLGTSIFQIDSMPRQGGTPCSIVNEGFGINQMAYLLSVCLHRPFKIVAVEEPEIHLHPSLVRKLARTMLDIATTEDRRLIVSTHSESFVTALLSQIATGKAGVDDVTFILAENADGASEFTQQEAAPDGTIQGGIESFISGEMEDLATFLGLSA